MSESKHVSQLAKVVILCDETGLCYGGVLFFSMDQVKGVLTLQGEALTQAVSLIAFILVFLQ